MFGCPLFSFCTVVQCEHGQVKSSLPLWRCPGIDHGLVRLALGESVIDVSLTK